MDKQKLISDIKKGFQGKSTEELIEENEKDLIDARQAGLAPAMVDRLALDVNIDPLPE